MKLHQGEEEMNRGETRWKGNSTAKREHSLAAYRVFILDMDGTFYLGEQLLPGALEFIREVQHQGGEYLFLTNNSSRTAGEYVAKLRRLGLETNPRHVMTSADATMDWLHRETTWTRLFLCATPVVSEAFHQAGFSHCAADPQAVVLTYDTTLTYEKIAATAFWLDRGLPLVATHPDILCPSPQGFLPDLGSFLAMFEKATHRTPNVIIGKPNPYILRMAMQRLGAQPRETLMVGDRLYTDIACGDNTGVDTALVLSGETKQNHLEETPHSPTWVFAGLDEMWRTLAGSPQEECPQVPD